MHGAVRVLHSSAFIFTVSCSMHVNIMATITTYFCNHQICCDAVGYAFFFLYNNSCIIQNENAKDAQ